MLPTDSTFSYLDTRKCAPPMLFAGLVSARLVVLGRTNSIPGKNVVAVDSFFGKHGFLPHSDGFVRFFKVIYLKLFSLRLAGNRQSQDTR